MQGKIQKLEVVLVQGFKGHFSPMELDPAYSDPTSAKAPFEHCLKWG